MNNRNDFEDKASKLMSKLTSHPSTQHQRYRAEQSKMSIQELNKVKEELQCSDLESRKKMKGLNDNLKKLEGGLIEGGQMRAQKGTIDVKQMKHSARQQLSYRKT